MSRKKIKFKPLDPCECGHAYAFHRFSRPEWFDSRDWCNGQASEKRGGYVVDYQCRCSGFQLNNLEYILKVKDEREKKQSLVDEINIALERYFGPKA